MVFKETLETTFEAEKEVQKTITFLKEHSFLSSKHIGEQKYIKSYAEELLIEGELKWLSKFLKTQKNECEKELNDFKESVNKECLRIKCGQIENMFANTEDDGDEFFGEE
jgi:hypothetical protein